MEEQIKRALGKLRISYGMLWGIVLLLILLGEADFLPVGMLASDVRETYLFETAGILLTAICTPLALKLFALILVKKIDQVSFPVALELYERWSNIRLVVLGIAIIANIFIYYITLSNTGILCTLIILTASLFCIPGAKRLHRELHINNGELNKDI